jgi:hypothetical protein
MAQVYQLELNAPTQAVFDTYAHSLLFADQINPVAGKTPEAGSAGKSIIVTSGVESSAANADYELLADDSQSEVSIDISTGKFVDGNLIAVWATNSEAQSDLRDFMSFFAETGDVHLHVGVCNTTQSQDYTPAIIENSRVIKMLSPAQVNSLGL